LKRIITTVLVTILLAAFSVGAAQVDVNAILRTIDKQSAFPATDFSAKMTMVTEDPGKGIEKQVVTFFRRDKDDKYLLLIQEPKIQKGQGYLLLGDSLWFYDPESRNFTHTSLKENFQGTDAKNSDFSARSYAEDYKSVSVAEGRLGSYDVYIIELEATNNEVTYPYLKLWVSKSPLLVLKAEEYSLSKRLLRTSLYPQYVKVADAFIPQSMIFTDALVAGKKTTITLSDISLNQLADSVFTKSFIERANR
jgi:outer membrane lipoprotein-sorting protein